MGDATAELTAREREVLELVRAGLTNDEIAERLGITSDGVKYHVSQVLSKLGVSSRHEAVDAAFGERRRRWWESVLASTLLRVAGAGAALVVVVFVALLAFGVLKSGGSDGPDASGLTVDSVVGSVQGAATRPGEALHSKITAVSTTEGVTVPYYTTELWVDAASETVRYEYRLDPASYRYDQATESTEIIAGKYSYVQDSLGKAYRYEAEPNATRDTTCAGLGSIWLVVLLSCASAAVPGPIGEPRIESGEFGGRGAIVIAYGDAELPSIDPNAAHPTVPVDLTPPPLGSTGGTPDVTATIRYSWRIYLDGGTYLPIGYKYAQVDEQGFGVAIEATYDNQFVPLDQDIQTLLDPSSIGYGVAEGDAEAQLNQIAAQLPVYWLGQEFAGGDGLGALTLSRINVGGQTGGVQQTYSVAGELRYQAGSGYPTVNVFLWRKQDWQNFLATREGQIIVDTECGQAVPLSVDGATATAFIFPTLEFPDPGQPRIDDPNSPSTPDPQQTYSPAPGESQCNFERRMTALVDYIIGVADYGDVVVEVRQDGEVISSQRMELLLRDLRAR